MRHSHLSRLIVLLCSSFVLVCSITAVAFGHQGMIEPAPTVIEKRDALPGRDGHEASLRVDLIVYTTTFRPAAEMAVAEATSSDIVCDASGKHVVLVYAKPSDKPDRFSTIAPIFQQEIYKVSAFYGSESLNQDSTKMKRLKVECSGGLPVIHQVNLSVNSAAATFGTVRTEVRNAGYGAVTGVAGNQHVVVFLDAPCTCGAGAAGIGIVVDDDSASALNANMGGGLFAQVYAQSDTGARSIPRWWTIMHELGHTFGAVQMTAPNVSDNTGASHCNDGMDTMCYDDGGNVSNFTSTSCSVIRFDCNGNDYFNPTPPAGNYLATHWNIASPLNTYLEHSTVAGDAVSPSTPTDITISEPGTANQQLVWDASTDNVGVLGYAIEREIGSNWQLMAVDSGTSFPIGTYVTSSSTYRVYAFDRAGNQSAPITIETTSYVNGACIVPARPVFKAGTASFDRVTFAWKSNDSAACVAKYVIYQQVGTEWKALRSTTSQDATIDGLKPGSTVVLGLRAVKSTGHASNLLQMTFHLATDVRAPSKPGSVKAKRRNGRTTVSWKRSTDDWRVASYEVQARTGRKWRKVATTTTKLSVKLKLAKGSVRVRAIDAAGKKSSWSRSASF